MPGLGGHPFGMWVHRAALRKWLGHLLRRPVPASWALPWKLVREESAPALAAQGNLPVLDVIWEL